MKTLELFNAVVAKPAPIKSARPFVSEDGFIIDPEATWAKDRIVEFYTNQRLSGNDLNKGFHKSFEKVRSSTRWELAIEQIRHYASTYGTHHRGEIYIPDEVLEVPDVKLTFKVVQALTKEEISERCLNMLRSGIALNEETINDLLTVLVDELGYTFTGKEGIKNKEAIIKIADVYGVVPDDTMEFFRYVIYRATGESLLIKNKAAVETIKKSNFNPSAQFRSHGVERLAVIFNRFKPLFLAFKTKCPSTINKISKLSKSKHKPVPQNALNQVTQRLLTDKDVHWLDNATPFALFKAVTACWTRLQGQKTFNYRVRNGKSWVKESTTDVRLLDMLANLNFLVGYMKGRFDLSEHKIFVPEGIEYAIPTSEKMFVGNIPTGTKFKGESLAVGIYWENRWGANDLDLSSSSMNAKIGWNAGYSNVGLTYSGDITSAPNGAVEYLHCKKGVDEPWVIRNNVYSGSDTAGYKILVGAGEDVSKPYLMDPNKVIMEVKTEAVQKQMVLGLFLPEGVEGVQSFVLLNFGAGHCRVSAAGGKGLTALHEQYRSPYDFKLLCETLGAELVDDADKATVDLSIDKLDKDSFTKLFLT